jgi:hypothetical protein
MQKNIIWVIVLIIASVGSYYAGKSSVPVTVGQNRGPGGQFAGRLGNRAGVGGFVTGKIIAKDATSITVELRSGTSTDTTAGTGSKIVFISDTTNVTKTATGSLTDLAIGTEVSAQGTPNSDGSVTATMVQIRPTGR